MLNRDTAKSREILAAVQILLEPAAERVCARLSMEKTPGFTLLGVIAFVEVSEHVLDGLRPGQFRVTGVENCGRTVGFFFNQMDDAMTDRHGLLGVK